MKVNLPLPNKHQVAAVVQPWELGVGGAELAAAGRTLDSLGFHALAIGEHYVIPRDHEETSGAHYLQATTALAFLAGQTSRIVLSSHVTLVPLSHPLLQAKSWSLLDWLSGGRARLVVGTGWLRGEFEALGVSFDERGDICNEYIEAMLAIWSGEVEAFEGRYVRFHDLVAAPRPLQRPHPPLWFAGDSPRTLRRVAAWGAGWSAFQTPPEDFPRSLDYMRAQPSYDGRPLDLWYDLAQRRIGPGHRATGVTTTREWNADAILSQLEWLATLGVTQVTLLMPTLTDFQHYLDWAHWAAKSVLTEAAAL